jgi:hypothetical protein
MSLKVRYRTGGLSGFSNHSVRFPIEAAFFI